MGDVLFVSMKNRRYFQLISVYEPWESVSYIVGTLSLKQGIRYKGYPNISGTKGSMRFTSKMKQHHQDILNETEGGTFAQKSNNILNRLRGSNTDG